MGNVEDAGVAGGMVATNHLLTVTDTQSGMDEGAYYCWYKVWDASIDAGSRCGMDRGSRHSLDMVVRGRVWDGRGR